MKKSVLLFTALAIFTTACQTNTPAPLSEQDKEHIQHEISPLVSDLLQNITSGDYDKSIALYANQPEFVSINNGRVVDYKTFNEEVKAVFGMIDSQRYNEALLKYTFIDHNNVVVTWGGNAYMKMKNGMELQVDPFAVSLVFHKGNEGWKVIYNHESGVMSPIAPDTAAAATAVQ